MWFERAFKYPRLKGIWKDLQEAAGVSLSSLCSSVHDSTRP